MSTAKLKMTSALPVQYATIVDRPAPRFLDALAVMAIAILTALVMLGQGPLAGTEPQRAITAHQMATSGDWLVPRLLDQVYLAKPPLHYWILAAMEKITGRADPLIWRLPSAIAGGLTAAILSLMTARWFGRLSGLVSGIACCSLLALWGQNRTAEIDALNTTACIACSCFLLDLELGPPTQKVWMTFAAAISLLAALLLKGPAGFAPILGALLGPAIFNRTLRHLKPRVCISLACGVLAFAAYVWLTRRYLAAMHLPVDLSGVNEAGANILSDRRKNLLHNLVMPIELFLYALPISLALPLALHPALWKKQSSDAAPDHARSHEAAPDEAAPADWSKRDRLLLRGLVGAIVVSLAVTMLLGLVHPRYSYVWLPLICPVAGAIAAARQRHIFGTYAGEFVVRLIPTSAVVFTIATLVVAAIVLRHRPQSDSPLGQSPLLYGSALAAIIICLWNLRAMHQRQYALGARLLIPLLLLAAIPFAQLGVLDRQHRSILPAANALELKLPAGQPVTTANLALDDPALFYYAKLPVESHPDVRSLPREFPTSRWVVLNATEYAKWSKAIGDRLTQIQRIDSYDGPIFLAWYIAPTTAQ